MSTTTTKTKKRQRRELCFVLFPIKNKLLSPYDYENVNIVVTESDEKKNLFLICVE